LVSRVLWKTCVGTLPILFIFKVALSNKPNLLKVRFISTYSINLISCNTVVKTGGIFLLPRIFSNFLMKIVQQIFRKNVFHSISWHVSRSISNFSSSHIPWGMMKDSEIYWEDYLLIAVLPPLVLRTRHVISPVVKMHPLTQEYVRSNRDYHYIYFRAIIPRIVRKTSLTINFGTFPSL
jgi:hypothetical protein